MIHTSPFSRRWTARKPRLRVSGLLAALIVAAGLVLGEHASQAAASPQCPYNGYIAKAWWTYDLDPFGAVDLAVMPTRCGLDNAWYQPKVAFAEAIRKAHGALNSSTLYHQFQCHAAFANGRVPLIGVKSPWDLEPWRKDLPFAQQIRYQCNPPPAGPVYGVGVGKISDATSQAFRFQAEQSGGPPALGEPHTSVLPYGSYGHNCIQFFYEGWRGPSAIFGVDCSNKVGPPQFSGSVITSSPTTGYTGRPLRP